MESSAKNSRYWTKEEEETVKRMVLEGSSLFEIAQALNRSPMAVILRTRILSGLERPDVKHRMPEDYYDQRKTIVQVASNYGRTWTVADNAQLQKMFDNGKNIFEIADFFSRTPTAIIKQIEKINDTPEKKTVLFQKAKLLMGKKRILVKSEKTPKEYT